MFYHQYIHIFSANNISKRKSSSKYTIRKVEMLKSGLVWSLQCVTCSDKVSFHELSVCHMVTKLSFYELVYDFE